MESPRGPHAARGPRVGQNCSIGSRFVVRECRLHSVADDDEDDSSQIPMMMASRAHVVAAKPTRSRLQRLTKCPQSSRRTDDVFRSRCRQHRLYIRPVERASRWSPVHISRSSRSLHRHRCCLRCCLRAPSFTALYA